MDTERIQRWTLPGVVFIVSFITFYLYFIGDITNIFGDPNEISFETIFALVAALLTTPVIGLIISTILMKLLEAIIGYKIHYGFPEGDYKQKIIEDAVKFDKSGKMEMYDSKLGYWKRRAYKRRFYPYYQVLVRRQIQGEELRFLERRWTVYWTHINNLASITIAFASVWSFKSAGSQTNSNVHLLAGYFIIALALYFIAAMFQIRRLKHENKETEHLFLLNPKP